MNFDNSLKRSCVCGQREACDQESCVPDLDHRAACLSDSEIRTMLTVLLKEWRIRCSAEMFQAESRH